MQGLQAEELKVTFTVSNKYSLSKKKNKKKKKKKKNEKVQGFKMR
jgi:hypothetical protein